MKTKTTPVTLETVEGFFDEVDEWYERVHQIRLRLGRLRRGSDAYLELLPDLWTEVDVLSRKAEYAAEALDEFEESLAEE